MAKTEFLASETLYVSLEPFIDPTTGAYIEASDTVSADVVKPDLSTTTVSFTRNSTSKIWTASISTGSYMQGRWEFRATSSDSSNPKPQYRVCWWGTGIHANSSAIKAKTDNLPSDPASETGALATALSTLNTMLTAVKRFLMNRKRFDRVSKTEITYADDNTTPLYTQAWRDNTGTNSTPGALTAGTLISGDVHEVDKAA